MSKKETDIIINGVQRIKNSSSTTIEDELEDLIKNNEDTITRRGNATVTTNSTAPTTGTGGDNTSTTSSSIAVPSPMEYPKDGKMNIGKDQRYGNGIPKYGEASSLPTGQRKHHLAFATRKSDSQLQSAVTLVRLLVLFYNY